MKKMHSGIISLIFFSLLALSGCSERSTQDVVTSLRDTPQQPAVIAPEAPPVPTTNRMPRGDRNKPLTDYSEWRGNNHVMFVFHHLSNIPPDYDTILFNYSRDFRQTNDNFRRNDIRNALKAQIDAEIAEAGQQRYLKATWSNFSLSPFNFETSSFPQNQLTNNSTFFWSENFLGGQTYRLQFTNGDDFRNLIPQDEASARRIEEIRSRFQGFDLNLYTFAQSADLSSNSVRVEIIAVQLLDRQGNVLLTQFRK